MKKLFDSIFVVVALLLAVGCKHDAKNSAIEANASHFSQLDSLIECAGYFQHQKEQRLSLLREQLASSKSAQSRYEYLKKLFWEYRVYNSDSALYYVKLARDHAQAAGNKDWIIDAIIDDAFVYTSNGLLNEALHRMLSLNSKEMTQEQRSNYYGQMRTLCNRLQTYTLGNDSLMHCYKRMYELYSDSTLATALPSEYRYYYVRVWKYINDPQERRMLIKKLEEIKASITPDSRNYSILTYNIALLYEYEGNEEERLRNFIEAAMSDVRAANRDVGSFNVLASYLYENGDLDRAYRYCTFSLNLGIEYNGRVRILDQIKLHNQINKSYIERNAEREQRLRLLLVGLIVLAIALIVLLAILYQQVKKRIAANRLLREKHESLSVLNAELQRLNDQLRHMNYELRDANYIKEEYIGQVFNLCSLYISKMGDFRKKLLRKLKANQLDDLKQLITTHSSLSNELKEFYETFDMIILNIFPDFVEEFNKLLKPEERIDVKPGKLNTMLRIYVLIRLQITDSEKISELLHCSVQTVYNTRSMAVGKAQLSKDEFLAAVNNLCRAANGTKMHQIPTT